MTKRYRPFGPFVTPPECQGQMVEYSYALDNDHDVIIERRCDRSDRSTSYCAYVCPDGDDWSPWNGTPKLGKEIGPCLLEE